MARKDTGTMMDTQKRITNDLLVQRIECNVGPDRGMVQITSKVLAQRGMSNNMGDMTAIDKAIQAAMARRNAKLASGTAQAMTETSAPAKKKATAPAPTTTDETSAPAKKTRTPKAEAFSSSEPPLKKEKQVSEKAAATMKERDERRFEREAKKEQRAKALEQLHADRDKRQAERAAKKEATEMKRAEDTLKRNAHMKKVERAAAKLPMVTPEAAKLVSDCIASFPPAMVLAIAAHLQHNVRAASTIKAASAKLNEGDTVRIISGDAKHIGKLGTVVRAQRIRCYVSVPGAKRDVYLFTSDVEQVAEHVTDNVLPAGTQQHPLSDDSDIVFPLSTPPESIMFVEQSFPSIKEEEETGS